MASLTQTIGVLFRTNRRVSFTADTTGVIEFDAVLNETHAKTNEVTTHPIETGSNVTDHIRTTPDELEINGVVSNTPLQFFGTAAAEQLLNIATAAVTPNSDPTTRAGEAYRRLRQIMDDGELVTVFTTLREYTNMAIVSMNVTRNAQNGRVLNATMRLREVISVAAQQQSVPVPVDDTNAKQLELGKKNVADATPEQTDKAVLSNSGENGSVQETSTAKQGIDNLRAKVGR